MNTIVTDWQIVSIIEGSDLVGKILYATIVDDPSCRFGKGDYVCTSKIETIRIDLQLIKTITGSLYQILGNGSRAEIEMKDFELLRNGFSPKMINQLNLAPNDYFH
tara:strand:- start:14809 stop:15126 length:318 start_codon:yes stop_codon:yes gene_type:complete